MSTFGINSLLILFPTLVVGSFKILAVGVVRVEIGYFLGRPRFLTISCSADCSALVFCFPV